LATNSALAKASLREKITHQRVAPNCEVVDGEATDCELAPGAGALQIRVYEQNSQGNVVQSGFESEVFTLSDLYSSLGSNEISTTGNIQLGASGSSDGYPWDRYTLRIVLTAQSQDVDLPVDTYQKYGAGVLSGQNVGIRASCYFFPQPQTQSLSTFCGPDHEFGALITVTRPFLMS
jgi:hypothetical protein